MCYLPQSKSSGFFGNKLVWLGGVLFMGMVDSRLIRLRVLIEGRWL